MVTQKFDLNMIPGKPKPIIRASQYDTGLRAFEVSLFAGTDTYTIPSGATLTVQGTKPDYTGFSYSATYTDNIVSFDCTDQMTACAGAVEMEIAVVNDGERVATANFVLQVEPAALKDDTIISETDIPIIEKLPEMMEDMDKLISTFGGPNVAETAAEMTDQDKVYVYIGSETGYNSGHWYYYDKTAHVWKDGGIYQSAGMDLDTTLSVSGKAADAKAVGDALALKANLASPTFTGYPKAPTASLISYSTQIANTEFVQRLVMPLDDAVNGLEPTEVPMHLVVDGTTGTWEQGGKTYTYDLLPGDEVKVTAGERDAYLVWYTIQGGSEAVNVLSSHTVTAGSTRQWGTTDARTLAVLIEDASENDVSPAYFAINGVEKGLTERVDALETTKQDTLTFDSAPTEGSTNPVTSGGVWEAVQTDKTLAVEDKAADAKTTGNRIAELKDELENGGLLITTGMIEQGTYNSAGDVVSSSTRIRTTGFIPVEKGGTVQFAPGANAQNIFYGKFNAEKRFITDGTWGSGNINIDWDGYIILVFRKAGNENITPEEYDATTILMNSVENKAATVAEITQTENPMNPLLFDMMYFKKGAVVSGTEYSTRYEKSTFINNQFADLNAVSATGNSGYIAFLFNTINQPKVLTSGESVDYYALVKTNKQLTLKPRLSASTTWSGVFSVAVADSISLSVGYNCVKMHFTYDHTGSSAADNYRFMVFEGNNVFTDLEAEFVFVRGETFLGWAKTLQAAEEEYSTDLLFWGDSLTAGAGGGDTSYPKVCSETLGLSRLNCGVGGESANTVAARQGGNNIIIPAGAVNGSYPIDAGFADLFGGIVQPLRQGDGAGSGSKILVNGIECNLANSGGNYVISGYTGTAITTPAIGTFAGNNYTGKVVCIFVGQNGSTFDGLSDYNARIAIIESMIKHINHNRYVILGLSTGTNASREADDRAMLAKFGNKFFPTRKMLVENGMTIAGLTPTAQDTTDISNGTVPTSLRSDGIHLNSYGYTALGKMVAEKIVSLGYLT